jgi:hypothetical protein
VRRRLGEGPVRDGLVYGVGLALQRGLAFLLLPAATRILGPHDFGVASAAIDYEPRAGHSKCHPWRDTKSYLTQIVRMVLSYNPLRIFMPIALLLGAIGFAKLGYDWATRDFHLATNTLLVLLAALQILAIGLVADLVVRVTKPELRVDPAGLTRTSPS